MVHRRTCAAADADAAAGLMDIKGSGRSESMHTALFMHANRYKKVRLQT